MCWRISSSLIVLIMWFSEMLDGQTLLCIHTIVMRIQTLQTKHGCIDSYQKRYYTAILKRVEGEKYRGCFAALAVGMFSSFVFCMTELITVSVMLFIFNDIPSLASNRTLKTHSRFLYLFSWFLNNFVSAWEAFDDHSFTSAHPPLIFEGSRMLSYDGWANLAIWRLIPNGMELLLNICNGEGRGGDL